MATIKQIKDELHQIGKVYPTVLGLLQKACGSKTVGHVWAETILNANLADDHFSNVCYEYCCLEKQLPERQDQLVFEIVTETKDRMDRDQRKLEQHVKYHSQPRSGPADRLWYRVMHWLYDRETPLPEEQLEELLQWANHNGTRPEWLEANVQ